MDFPPSHAEARRNKSLDKYTEDFFFIEIGTADFDMLAEQLPEDQPAYGIVVEPLPHYAQKLPRRPKMTVVQAAVSPDHTGYDFMHFIPEDRIQEYQLPTYLRGCAALGRPHLTAANDVLKANLSLEALQTKLQVPTLSIADLLARYSVRSVSFLKLDIEGLDSKVLLQYLQACEAIDPQGCAHLIEYEFNAVNVQLTPEGDAVAVEAALVERGYNLYRDLDNIVAERPCVSHLLQPPRREGISAAFIRLPPGYRMYRVGKGREPMQGMADYEPPEEPAIDGGEVLQRLQRREQEQQQEQEVEQQREVDHKQQ